MSGDVHPRIVDNAGKWESLDMVLMGTDSQKYGTFMRQNIPPPSGMFEVRVLIWKEMHDKLIGKNTDYQNINSSIPL